MTERRFNILCGLVVASGAALRFWNLGWGLPGLFEEATPLARSWGFWPTDAGWSMHPHFFNYPALSFYLHWAAQALHFTIGHVAGWYADSGAFRQAFGADPSAAVLVSRSVSVCCDLGTVWLTSRIGRRLHGQPAGLLAAMVIALSPLHVRLSQQIAVDVPLALLCTLAVLCMMRLGEGDAWYRLAGLAVGLAAATKYTGALMLLPLGAAHVAASGRRPWTRLLLAALIAAGVFLVLNPFTVLDAKSFIADFTFERDHMRQGHFGLLSDESSPAFYLGVLPAAVGWFVLFLGAAAPVALRPRVRMLWMAPAATVIVFLLAASAWTMRADRYLLPALPSLVALGASSAVGFWERLGHRLRHRLPAPLLAVAAALAAQPLLGTLSYHRSIEGTDTRLEARAWVSHNLRPGSCVAMAPLGLVLDSAYVTFPIPYAAVGFQHIQPLYDARWYQDMDMVVGSDFDYLRLEQEPDLYRDAVRYFYDSLSTRWQVVHRILPEGRRPGPRIWLFAPPPGAAAERFSEDLISRLDGMPNRRILRGFVANMAAVLEARGRQAKADQLRAALLDIVRRRSSGAEEFRMSVDYLLSRAPGHRGLLAVRDSLARVGGR